MMLKKKALAKVSAAIIEGGGKVEKTIDWKRRKLSYQIKGSREGHYYLVYFYLPTVSIKEFIRENALNEDLLRSMHVSIESIPEDEAVEFKQNELVNKS